LGKLTLSINTNCETMKKSILVILAPGFEEIEAITPIDILRRADIDVTIASLENDLHVRSRGNIIVIAETKLNDVLNKNFDAILLPGGPGTKNLRDDSRVLALVNQFHDEGKLVGAICAAPTVLLDAGLLDGKRYTAHFSVNDELTNIQKQSAVIKDRNIITSQGPGTAPQFGFALVEALINKQAADKIASDICYL
jgi:4-methyl-5(b-hydroxyethyl)-thiazole monophosphate biosynthesis